ncbi:MAG: preprotein translocase subunit SecE [Firmicutes bacterium]|nr:preprotein translocase subunit SecE [Bacillota bacterium]
MTVKKEKVNRVEQAQKFFRGALNELKKVHWPTRREIAIYTSVVLVAVVVVGVLNWVFDLALSSALKLIQQR